MCCITKEDNTVHTPPSSWLNLINGVQHPIRLARYQLSNAGQRSFGEPAPHFSTEIPLNSILRRPVLTRLEAVITQILLVKLNNRGCEYLLMIAIAKARQHRAMTRDVQRRRPEMRPCRESIRGDSSLQERHAGILRDVVRVNPARANSRMHTVTANNQI